VYTEKIKITKKIFIYILFNINNNTMSVNERLNNGFRGLSKSSIILSNIYSSKNALLNKLRVKNTSDFENNVKINGTLNITSERELIESKNLTFDQGFTVGNDVEKDMYNDDYTQEFDPYDYQENFFPGMSDFVDGNIVSGDKAEENRLVSSTWDDLGNDIFDDWGYFYLYDVNSGKYYFPLISPQNLDDGIITTQTFSAFGRTFTIKHGWTAQGIFKFDVSVDDGLPFKFGMYGNMGSDEDTIHEVLSQSYSLGVNDLTLYYNYNIDDGSDVEILYTYFIPKNVDDNNAQTFDVFYDDDYVSIMSKEIKFGLLVYFSKTNDVKDWVINDLELSSEAKNNFAIDEEGNAYIKGDVKVNGDIVAAGKSLGKLSFVPLIGDSNYTPSPDLLINGYFTSQTLNDNRTFVIPSASDIIAAIPDCAVNTSFRFTINNYQDGNYSEI